MNGKLYFHIATESRPDRTISERAVSERGRKELLSGTQIHLRTQAHAPAEIAG